MKISVLVPGRLHGFDMAIYFQKLGVLNQLVTGYPVRYVLPFGIKKQYIKSLYINEIINRTTKFLGFGYPFDFLACEAFDFLASKIIKYDSDVYFIWSGYALKTIKTLRKKNPQAKIILVRGSAHIEEQERLLKKVIYVKKHINLRIIEKELKEYYEADYITVPSTYAFNTFIEKGFKKEKLFINLLGVDLNQFPFQHKREDKEKIVLGYVGTLSSRKGIDSVINVIARLNDIKEIFDLNLTGPIDHKTFDATTLKKHDFIMYNGIHKQKELYRIYWKIDVLILNSLEDGFGMVLLQAMSCGCAIIATKNTGGPDVIQNYKNGIIIPANDENELEKALLWFDKNKDKIPKMGMISRNISENEFTWDAFGKRNIEFLNKLNS
ncbi:glycosyltransferase family 4 protein [Pedobacter sp.]|uniref:glycosyltransferase family 4 protein n=1 Tax=Pedobacter sp. TaxID=1411316 RepID=UPI003BAC17CA